MTASGAPTYVLCADDFAMTEGVSRSILDLLAAGRLSATGAMTSRPHWRRLAGELGSFSGRADLGLHFNLTCAEPLGAMPTLAPQGAFPGLGGVLRHAAMSASARKEIAAELERQLDAFEDALGRAPDFVDGHQHVQALPGVRDAVIEAVARRYPSGACYVRDPSDAIAAIVARGVAVPKALVVSALATGFGAALARAGIPANRGFAGVSPFDPARDFGADLGRFLLAAGPRHLVMVHPGYPDAELATLDPVVATRPIEHDALMAGAASGRAVRFAELSGG